MSAFGKYAIRALLAALWCSVAVTASAEVVVADSTAIVQPSVAPEQAEQHPSLPTMSEPLRALFAQPALDSLVRFHLQRTGTHLPQSMADTLPDTLLNVETVVVSAKGAKRPTLDRQRPIMTRQLTHRPGNRRYTLNDRLKLRGVTNMQHIFVPRGQWITGANFAFSTHTNENYTVAVIEGIESEGYNFRVSPMIAYALTDNMAVGARFTYSRTNLTVDNADLKFGDEETGTEIFINDYKTVTHSYTVSAIWRQYIPLGKSRRFAIFNEISLGAGGIQSIFAADQPIRGTYERGYTLSLGVSPGLMAFATNDVAIEVNVGVMGISFSDVEQVHNQVDMGHRRSSNMNFKVNLLSIGVGVSFYL